MTYVEQIDEDGSMSTVFVAERQRSATGTVLSTTLAQSGAIEIDLIQVVVICSYQCHRYSVSPGKAKCAGAIQRIPSLIPGGGGGLRSQAQVETLPTSALIGSDNSEHMAILGGEFLAFIVPVMVLFAIPLVKQIAGEGVTPSSGLRLSFFYCISLRSRKPAQC